MTAILVVISLVFAGIAIGCGIFTGIYYLVTERQFRKTEKLFETRYGRSMRTYK